MIYLRNVNAFLTTNCLSSLDELLCNQVSYHAEIYIPVKAGLYYVTLHECLKIQHGNTTSVERGEIIF